MTSRTAYQQQLTLNIADETVAVKITASRRKSMRLQLSPKGEVDVRIPVGISKSQVLAFLKSNESWLLEKYQAHKALQKQRSQVIIVGGKEYPIVEKSISKLQLADEVVFVPVNSSPEQIQQMLEAWLRALSKVQLKQMIERWWPFFSQYSAKQPVLRVKKMRTRWGSLSQRGYINLNIALVQLPEELMELVVVHELCHLKHFDHGPGFKQLMSQCLPDWKQREQALQSYGYQLLT